MRCRTRPGCDSPTTSTSRAAADVHRQAGVDVRLDRLQAKLVHHLQRRRHDAGGDDVAHRRRSVLDRPEVEQHRAHHRRVLGEPDADCRRNAAHPLAADERAAKVVAGRFGILAAEHRDVAVRQHHLDRDDVARRHPFGEAVRATRVVGDVAADRARLLTARVGREVQPELGDVARQVEVEHTRLDPRLPGRRVDRQDPVHLRDRDDHRTVERYGSAGQSGSGTAGHEWRTVPDRGLHAVDDFGGRHRKAHGCGDAFHVTGIAPVQRQVGGALTDPVRLEARPSGQRRGSASASPASTLGVALAHHDRRVPTPPASPSTEQLVAVAEVVAESNQVVRRVLPSTHARDGGRR